ncbi:hypothetical protein F53441_133 [Fusarium austroafricanum]|uniref:Uncharacterized protein n=1 Tax=Fusarium austroafricanum TaxID=2364996 RepID=A0A8H4P5H2_9HYPO|nr:hypothetical protein F53441_133 [Fusarium austroafricanum]
MPQKGSNRNKSRRSPIAFLDSLQDAKETRSSFLRACCGNTPNQPDFIAGLELFATLIEARMLDCETAMTSLLNVLWHSHTNYSYIKCQYKTLVEIARLIRSSTSKTTIADLADQVFEHFQVDETNRKLQNNTMRHLIFASIGWLTMLYTAKPESCGSDFTIKSDHRVWPATGNQRASSACHRPLGAVLRNYEVMPIACPPEVRASSGRDRLLSVTHLNFFTMSRLGDVTVTWVDDLSKHCDFDRYSRTKELKLFRVPSICAKICLSESEEVLIGRLFGSHNCNHSCTKRAESLARSYLIEVLLSYRLLFGQHRSSRKLFLKHEQERAKYNGSIDPLLCALCGTKDMGNFTETMTLLRERGVYNADINFPHLGARLAELADYSASQRPRDLVEVWNDERDPERLFAFRSLIIVGVVSISLSFVQIIVGLAQVGLSV